MYLHLLRRPGEEPEKEIPCFEWKCDDCDYHSNNGADDGFDNPPGFLEGLLEL
jgi:hypothetical protein